MAMTPEVDVTRLRKLLYALDLGGDFAFYAEEEIRDEAVEMARLIVNIADLAAGMLLPEGEK